MSETERDQTIDIARGLSITAIVLGHVLRGLASAQIVSPSSTSFLVTDRLLYTFHLSVFVFMSGLFVYHSVHRDGVLKYLRERDMAFLYLYLVWSLAQGTVKLLAASLVNTPNALNDLLFIWVPEGQLWFLPFMILLTTLVALVRPWRTRTLTVFSIAIATVMSVAFWGLNGPFAGTQGLGLTIFYCLGVAWGAKPFMRAVSGVSSSVAIGAGVASGAVFLAIILFTNSTPPTSDGDGRSVASVLLGVVASLFGAAAVVLVSRFLASLGRGMTWLSFVGQRTLEIFLAHILATAGIRILLVQLGVDDLATHVLAGTFGGVMLPILLWWVAGKVRFPWLFTAPEAFLGRRTSTNRLSRPDTSKAVIHESEIAVDAARK